MLIANTEVLFALSEEGPHHKELLPLLKTKELKIIVPAVTSFKLITILRSQRVSARETIQIAEIIEIAMKIYSLQHAELSFRRLAKGIEIHHTYLETKGEIFRFSNDWSYT